MPTGIYKRTPEHKRKISESHKGSKNYKWKGGKYIDNNGYVRILSPNHPLAQRKGYVMEHRLVMEKHTGRYLTDKESVHHINGIKTDNRIENLILFANESEHRKHHIKISPPKELSNSYSAVYQRKYRERKKLRDQSLR